MQARVRIENPELIKDCAEQGRSVVLLAGLGLMGFVVYRRKQNY